MAKLCLVRHGQTEWNITGKWQGHTDIPINETGKLQAYQASEELKKIPLDAIYTSDLRRAYVTAEIINLNHHLPIIRDARLREQNLGNWEGYFVKEIPALFPETWSKFETDPVHTRIDGGESVDDLANRISTVITEICQNHTSLQQVLIVSHGLSLAVFRCLVEGRPLKEAFHRIPPNAKPVMLDLDQELLQ